MPRDIDTIIGRVRALHPDAIIEQLWVSHPGVDDDGLWFFRLPDEKKDIQVESSTGAAPFIIETDEASSANAIFGASVDQVVKVVAEYFTKLKKNPSKANQSPQPMRADGPHG